jgi:hypothetical protein
MVGVKTNKEEKVLKYSHGFYIKNLHKRAAFGFRQWKASISVVSRTTWRAYMRIKEYTKSLQEESKISFLWSDAREPVPAAGRI